MKNFIQSRDNIVTMMRVALFSLLNNHKYNKSSILYPLSIPKVNAHPVVGDSCNKSGKWSIESYRIIEKLYAVKDGRRLLRFKDVLLSIPDNENDK